ncbi:interleukin-1 receptor-associated kinase-like 2 isoform X4 [Notamacropus eugenii]|uniref:interleukin-1 receptor-associated kinase-like 2 isoform X4 n=1 Tax=Notamacropus eugenii TaxID=9315 RepID=UPI003B670068
MALQPPLLPPLPALQSPRTSQYIYQLPSWVLEDLCHKMDSLNEWDWMQFGGANPEIAGASHVLPDPLCPGNSSLSSARKLEEIPERGPTKSSGSTPFSSSGPCPSGSTNQVLQLPSIEEDLYRSLQTSSSASSDMKQKPLMSLNGENLYWTETEVIKATNGFSQHNKISEGNFADVYKGQRHNMLYAFKKLQKTRCPGDISIENFFHMEVQICLRCSHQNILPLLGFCTGEVFHSVIHPYMPNGSVEDRLQCQDNTDPLTWEQRISISLGFLGAIDYLHGLKIIHGNIKSSNVLLERNFTPKLGHPRVRLSSDDKKSSYTMMNTQLFQALAAYVPEDFIRVGQLTERVDIFSCGIVLAEILTGIPAMDKERTPVYLKDLLISEISSTKALLCSKNKCVEKLAAKEICQKYQDAKAGHLPENCAVDFATAIYLCLQKKSPSLTQVRATVAELDHQIRNHQKLLNPGSNLELKRSSVNTPEETDDVDNLSTEVSSSDDQDRNGLWSGAESSSPQPGYREERCLTSRVEADSSTCPGPSHPQATENSWEVEVNDAKKKLMENILLYEEEKLNSEELFGSFKP